MTDEPCDEEAIFKIACQIASPEARVEYLHQICGDDVVLFGRVAALLRVFKEESDFLESPPQCVGFKTDIPSIPEKPGTQIGPYKLLQVIGEGGMGVVYMAEQTEPVSRCVALKIIKPGMSTREVIARFEAERQALALMDHPNIAKMLDAGTTESGHPYFVMELVKGRPITMYCNEHRLTPRQRLEIFIPVCQAIQHAHQKGLIHRDIKPSNVLIAPYDGLPVVKIIDFGVAKATGQRLTEKTLFTQFGAMVGTLEYMSPEQAELNNKDIDTRSDLYSLGVLLYELLTGTTPLDASRVKQMAFDEILRTIRDVEPPKPSTRLSDSNDTLPVISAQRQTEPAKLTKLMRGELDWIVMKALDKDRNRRYETANGFAMDVQRYLADEPVLACPTSTWYRARKFMRKNRGVLVTTGIVAAALIAGSALSAWQASEARAARILADQRLVLANTRLLNETEAREEANRQQQVANGNLHRAIDSVDEMVIRITTEKNRNISTAIISDALSFYDSLLKENEREPRVRHRTAMGFHRVATALYDLPGNTWQEQKLVLHKKVHHLLSDLHEQYPDSAIYAFDLAAAELALGWFTRRGPETIRHFQHNVDLLEPLAAWPPQDLSLDLLLVGNGRHCPAVVPPDVAKRDERESVSQVLICYLANAYRALGGEYVGQGKRDEGIALLEKAILTAQRAPDWNESVLGWCYADLMTPYESAGRFDDALAIVNKSLDCWRGLLVTQPDSIEFRGWQIHALDRKAGLLLRGGRGLDAFVPALVGLEAAMRLVDDFPTLEYPHNLYNQVGATLNATLLTADSQFVARDPNQVMETVKQLAENWKRLINEHPGHAGYHSGLIRCHQAQSRMLFAEGNTDHLAAAKQAWLSAVEVAETIPDISLRQNELHYFVEVLIRTGHIQEAELVMKRTIDICRKASDDFPTFIALQDDLSYRNHLMCRLWKTTGRLQQAEQCIRAALEILEKVVAQSPNSPVYSDRIDRYQFELSLIQWRNGHQESMKALLKQVSACREALVLKPTDPAVKQRAAWVLNNLAWELATVPEVEARNPMQALEFAKQAVELGSDANCWNTLGVAHYRVGDWKATIDALERSEKFPPGAIHGFNGFFLAMAHKQLAHQDEALTWYEQTCAWMEKNRPQDEELRRFRDEATELLKPVPKPPPKADTPPAEH